MLKFSVAKSFLLALFLCLSAANVLAQQPQLMPPPLPSVATSPPPDPDTLPSPPPLQWQPLPPRAPPGQASTPAPVAVPQPQPEASIAPPPPPVVETPLPGAPDPAQMELAKPDVEIWRAQSQSPQIPARRFNQLAQAYIAGNDPVVLRVQFDPLAAGKHVYVLPGRGIALSPPNAVLTVSTNGECVLSAQLYEGFARSHIIFYCEGIKTVLPISRASLHTVEVEEALTGGG